MHNLGKSHWNVIKYILAYIKEILNYGITYRADNKLNPTYRIMCLRSYL